MFIQNLFLVLIFCIEVVSPTVIIPPGMQRKKIYESCTFQWTIQGSFTSYTVNRKLTGNLSASAHQSEDRARGIISLTILNVQLEDAGNYLLSIHVGTSTTTDYGALLFVYGNSQSTLTVTGGSNPATEGSSVELTCSVTSSSLPAEYRPKLFYFWSVGDIPHLQNFSNASSNVDLLTGYSFKNDGRLLVVNSVQYQDRQIRCWGQEEGSSFVCCKASPVLTIHYRPQVLTRTPANKRFHADVGSTVGLSLRVDALPVITSGNWAWSFVNTAGVPTTLPPAITQDYQTYTFTLPSTSHYGTYTITLANTIGTTTETFQVLTPVPPETPSHLQVVYATHRQIQVQWNCMAFNGRQQTISVRLNETSSNTEIETHNDTVDNSCYNTTRKTLFQRKIRPEKSYEVSVWSSNALGASDVVNLVVTTSKKFKLIVSSKTIVFNATLATINFSTLNGNMTYLTVTCCAESTGICRPINYEKTDSAKPVLFYNPFDDEEVYFFDFTAYGGGAGSNKYYLTMVKGIRVSNTKNDDDETTNPLLISTAVLAVLLLVALLALVLLFVLIKRKKHRQDPPILPIIKEEKKPRDLPLPKRPLPTRKPTPSVAQKPPPEDDPEEETYELADAPKPTDDDFYMPLNEKPTRAMRNQYS